MRRSVVFDLDGTLVDSAAEIIGTLVEALHESGLGSVPPISPSAIGPPIGRILEGLGLGLTAGETAAVLRSFRRIYDSSTYARTRPYDGIPECLEELSSKGCRLFVATNKPLLPTTGIVERCFKGRFLGICSVDSLAGRSLTKTEMLTELSSRFAILSPDSVVIGDGAADLQAGERMGWWRVAALWGYGSEEELLAEKPQATARSPREICAILEAA